MFDVLKTMQIKPTHASQGEYVVINEVDFDPNQHEVYQDPNLIIQRRPTSSPAADATKAKPAAKKRR